MRWHWYPGLGGRRLAALLSRFGSAGAALTASRRTPLPADRYEASALDLLPQASLRAAEELLVRTAARGITVVTPADAAYPVRLRSIPDPPAILFLRGRLDVADGPAVAIVGSRDHTGYGRDVAHRLSSAAARAGICVVSGMARGLDAVAHQAALEVGGATVGVLGNGIGVVYPAANRELYRASRGARSPADRTPAR